MLNSFKIVDKPHPAEEELRAQRQWTRVYLIILILTLGIVMIFTAFTYQTETITVDKPTLNNYRNFEQSVDCPCTNSTIPYDIFIDLNMSFHDVCSSTFIEKSSNWTTMLYSTFLYHTGGNVTTFQRMALSFFLALQVMCETSIQTVKNERSLFLNSSFVSTSMMEFDLFHKQIDATLSNFKSNAVSSNFYRFLQIVRGLYSSSGFFSAFGTNWSPVIREEKGYTYAKTYMQAQGYNLSSCNCATSPICVQTMNLELKSGLLWPVPGMLSGCLPLDSMLESTLECLYDQACLDMISNTINPSLHYHALDANRTRFHPINTTKLDSIVTELFIEEWFENISFESYFNACQPHSCLYTVAKRFDMLHVLSTVIAFFGGLSLVLEHTIPFVFKIATKCLVKQKSRRVVPNNIS
jgi:hypothetical protein